MGYHAMPAKPGEKVPGHFEAGRWSHMARWQDWCSRMPPEFLHERWESWPDAGVCIAHGAVVGIDVDTDRKDVAAAVVDALGPSPVRRRGQRGWMGYYRPGPGCDGLGARLRWYHPHVCITGAEGRRSWPPLVELLLHGSQSVVPPTIHPDTGEPYLWLTPDTLQDMALADLPALPADPVALLDAGLGTLGLTRENPNGRGRNGHVREPTQAGAHDLEKPRFRSLNERALAALDRWFPQLGLPKTRQRGAGSWEAVAAWRPSSSGRPLEKRGANLHASPSGIRDFGDGEPYTAIDMVIAARGCSFEGAVEWLESFVDPEMRTAIDLDAIVAAAERRRAAAAAAMGRAEVPRDPPSASGAPVDLSGWCAMPALRPPRLRAMGRQHEIPSATQFDILVPQAEQPFPLAPDSFSGLLGEVAQYIDEASVSATDAGALALALPLLGAIMGRAYQSPTRLRTNIYAVALGHSGSGKTSLVQPAKELMLMAGVAGLIGTDRIASGPGLLQMLAAEPRRVCFLDEFGHMLQQIGAPGAGIHALQILSEFTRLFSSANTVHKGTAYATREPVEIDCPNLCLFGMTTPEQFWRAFGSASLEDGSIARYLLFPIGESGLKDPDERFQDRTVVGVKAVLEAMHGRVRGNLGRPECHTVPLEDAAAERWASLRMTMQACARYADGNAIRGGGPILLRVAENAMKIALISAAGRNPMAPVITMDDLDKAELLARWSACEMVRNIAGHIADNQVERDVNEVERRILKAGPEGILKGKLKDQVRAIRKREFDDIVASLEESGRIAIERTSSSTKPGFRLLHCGFGAGG
jgi:hypothetical protein